MGGSQEAGREFPVGGFGARDLAAGEGGDYGIPGSAVIVRRSRLARISSHRHRPLRYPGQAYTPQEIPIAGIGAQAFPRPPDPQPEEVWRALPVGFLEPFESLQVGLIDLRIDRAGVSEGAAASRDRFSKGRTAIEGRAWPATGARGSTPRPCTGHRAKAASPAARRAAAVPAAHRLTGRGAVRSWYSRTLEPAIRRQGRLG